MDEPIATEARIPRLPLDEARARAVDARVPPSAAELSVFRVLLRHPQLAASLNDVFATLMAAQSLDARLRELVIMRIAWVTGSEYEWTEHWPVACMVGVAEDDVLGVRDWRRHASFGEAERAVLEATDEVLATGEISQPVLDRCRSAVGGVDGLLELVIAIGLWTMFSTVFRSLAMPLEDGVAPWPPDGRSPDLRSP